MTALWAYLALSVLLGWGCIAGPRGTKAQKPGTPLSDQEYHQFFKFLRITIQASTACHLRELYGCKNSLVRRLDEYENHGVVPSGPVCSELPENPFFHNFCSFSLYRCIMKKYFLKRTVCPGHSTVKQSITAGTDTIISNDARSSSSSGHLPVPPMSPTSHSRPDTEAAVIPTSLPVSTLPNPSGPEAAEVTASDQHQGHLPNSDIEDLLLRILDSQVQTSLQTMKLLMSVGKAVKEEELRKAATSLLLALNNANVSWSPTN
ncbi:acrosin-binding protein-like [Onychostruthus taczanowskii]|uniref:acrosin-binding protein-like n=1 Tax=Onychostruthus taczanowskii TaxID=356909 RepID=UPI001B8013E4|nr:acrosin-binding protein-like [Onychostruthus taczanowskii]